MGHSNNLPDFWRERLKVNNQNAIFHQWEQLNATGCIENFRIAAGESDRFRQGLFFADSDAYKWLDAAAHVWASTRDAKLGSLMDDLIVLLGRAQQPDGYIFTYNQIHFHGKRWQNLQIEHELYCHGHLIEAGVSHYQATGRTDLLHIARQAANRIVTDFQGKGPLYTPGHEEIEIALIRLFQVTAESAYLDLARQLIDQRGRIAGFGWKFLRQALEVVRRLQYVQKQNQAYLAAHPGYKSLPVQPDNPAKKTWDAPLRLISGIISGRYNQQRQPVQELAVPVGHSVRFGYLETAAAMLARVGGASVYLPAAKQAWDHMVERRMYITGGIGSLALLEGFGNDYELDPEYAYAETCAALGSMFWSWEMAQLTGEAKYSDLFDWQLYNAAGVGLGLEGKTYFYNNPLASHGEIIRRPWYVVPCCPSNISRTLANLGNYLCSFGTGKVWIHQYINGEISQKAIPLENGDAAVFSAVIESALPWEGRVRIRITAAGPANLAQLVPLDICLRQPSWAKRMVVSVNEVRVAEQERSAPGASSPTASGYDPRRAAFLTFRRPWAAGDVIEISFDMPVEQRRAHPKVKGHQRKVTVTRGPLVYCLESIDNPAEDIFTAQIDPGSLKPASDPALLGGIVKIQGKTRQGTPLTFIPYFLWGNRGSAKMVVWVNL
jgi:uncharacterized protein